MPDGQRGAPWSYVFTEDKDGTRWDVANEAKVAIEPCLGPDFRIAVEPPSAKGYCGVRPSFTLAAGLYLVICHRGDSARSFGSSGADVVLSDGVGKVLHTTHSGFA